MKKDRQSEKCMLKGKTDGFRIAEKERIELKYNVFYLMHGDWSDEKPMAEQ